MIPVNALPICAPIAKAGEAKMHSYMRAMMMVIVADAVCVLLYFIAPSTREYLYQAYIPLSIIFVLCMVARRNLRYRLDHNLYGYCPSEAREVVAYTRRHGR